MAEDRAHFARREDHRQFKHGRGPRQLQFRRPASSEGFLPEELDGAQGLGGSLAGDLLDAFEVDEILTQLLGRDEVRSGMEMFGPLANAGEVGLLSARGDGQQFQILIKGF